MLPDYAQFFACYHKTSPNYYWDASGEVRRCSPESFTAVPDAAAATRIRHSAYHEHTQRNLHGRECTYAHYKNPVLMSERQPWFGDCRHAILVGPATCGSIVTWMDQARDYLICPPNHHLNPGESFSARVKHVVAPVNGSEDLEALWRTFGATVHI